MALSISRIGSFDVERQIYVPSSGGNFARFIDRVTNVGSGTAAVKMRIHGRLGSGLGTELYATASGDLAATIQDAWFATDAIGVPPPLAHLLQGNNAPLEPTLLRVSDNEFDWQFETILEAGQSMAIVTFAIQEATRTNAETEAQRLARLPADALVGAEAFLADVVNFRTLAPGAPRIVFRSPAGTRRGRPWGDSSAGPGPGWRPGTMVLGPGRRWHVR